MRSRPDLDGGRPNQRYQDNSGVRAASLNVAKGPVQDFILDSLAYWADEMGVDGFRFDLAPVLGNAVAEGGFAFDATSPTSLLQRMSRRLPLRMDGAPGGVDLIAEPWAVGAGTYQLGHFPDGWAEWNDIYRKTIRRAENKLHVDSVLPWQIANALSGSEQQFRRAGTRADGEAVEWSVNYVSSHDGFTLRDVFSYTDGDDAWDHGGTRAAQRKAVRNALALLMTSAGVPMLLGRRRAVPHAGRAAEHGRDRRRHASSSTGPTSMRSCAREPPATRGRCAQLRRGRRRPHLRVHARDDPIPRRAPRPCARAATSPGAPCPAARSRTSPGTAPTAERWSDGLERSRARAFSRSGSPNPPLSVYVAYCWRDAPLTIVLPANLAGARWRRVADTAEWMEPLGNVESRPATVIDGPYGMHPSEASPSSSRQ